MCHAFSRTIRKKMGNFKSSNAQAATSSLGSTQAQSLTDSA